MKRAPLTLALLARDPNGNPAIGYVRYPSGAGDSPALGVSVYTP